MASRTKDIEIVLRVRVPVQVSARQVRADIRTAINEMDCCHERAFEFFRYSMKASHVTALKPAIASVLRKDARHD